MTTSPQITRDSALMLPVLMGVGLVVGGWQVAAGTAAVGALAILNLWTLSRISSALTARLAEEDGDASLPALALAFKMMLGIPVVFALLLMVGPIPVALGLCTVVLGVAKTGFAAMISPDAGLEEENA